MASIDVTVTTAPITVTVDDGTTVTVGAGTVGPAGPKGDAGSNGTNGQGVPTGGTSGQVLAKKTGTNYDTQWVDQTGGGGSGTVTSVTGTAPISVATGTTTPVVSIAAATTSAAGSMSSSDKAKLDGVATGATANSSDATLLARANHTGTQALLTISDAGTAASKNVAATGDASATEVVLGSDTRLTDARTPADGAVTTAKLADSAVTSAKIADGTIVNADISASAAIATSKISGLGGAATLNVGTAASTVAAGDDSRITGAAQKASNLSDLASASTARTNLGLGGAATLAVGTTTGTVAAGDDSRFTDTRTPTDGSVSTVKIADSAVTSAKIADGTIVNADISASAAIATSKISGLTTVATDVIFDAAGDLPVGTGADTSARLAKGTRTQALVVGASTLEWDANHYNGGNFLTATVTGAIAETIPGGVGFGAVTIGTSGRAHLHGIYLPKGVTITTISVVSGSAAVGTPTNQWFALCDSSRTVLRVTVNDTTAAWNASTVKPLALTSTFTTTYSGLHYIAICVTATTVPNFRGTSSGTSTGVAQNNFLSTSGLTTPVAEGTVFAAAASSTDRTPQVFGILS